MSFDISSGTPFYCPHCSQQLHVQDFIDGGPGMAQVQSTVAFFCPGCKKLLNISKTRS